MNPVHELSPADQSDLADRLKYEDFLAELSLRFINQPPDQVDGAIEDAQRFFCENLGLERSSLYQRFEAEPGALLLTHIYEGGDNLPVRRVVEKRVEPKLRSSVYWVLTEANPPGTYIRVDVRALFPWVWWREPA